MSSLYYHKMTADEQKTMRDLPLPHSFMVEWQRSVYALNLVLCKANGVQISDCMAYTVDLNLDEHVCSHWRSGGVFRKFVCKHTHSSITGGGQRMRIKRELKLKTYDIVQNSIQVLGLARL